MKKWPWRRILLIASWISIFVGLAPPAYLLWFASAHNFQLLSMPIPFKQGEYTSPAFKADLNESYQVDVGLNDPTHRPVQPNFDAVLDLDWKIVDEGGTVIVQGAHNSPMGWATDVVLGQYQPKPGVTQRAIVNLHRDFDEPEGLELHLEIGTPEETLDLSYALPWSFEWAAKVAGPGAVILLVLLLLRVVRCAGRDTPSKTPQTP